MLRDPGFGVRSALRHSAFSRDCRDSGKSEDGELFFRRKKTEGVDFCINSAENV